MTPVREARPDDAPAVAAILSGWIDATPWMPRIHSHSEDRAFAERMIREMEVVVAGEPAQGFLARRGHFIHALYLAEDARGAGLGRLLLTTAKARSDRLTLWTFAANEAARRFYARQGFEVVESGDGSGNDEGLPDLRLEWRRGRMARVLRRVWPMRGREGTGWRKGR